MMPPHGKEIMLSQIEIELMSAFVRHKVFDDQECARLLVVLAKKLGGVYVESNEKDSDR